MNNSNRDADLGADDVLEQLLKASPPRPTPSPRDTAAARSAVHAEWRELANRRVSRRRVAAYAIAASLLLAVFATFNTFDMPAPAAVRVATIEKSIGPVYLLGESAELREFSDLGNVMSGQTIVTGAGAGLALAWANGGSLRVDQNTRVRFTSADAVYLQAGRVYFDSRPAVLTAPLLTADAGTFEIQSDHGHVTHIGTQFITSVDPDTLTVSVREGEVAIDGEYYDFTAASGQQVILAGRQRPSVLTIRRNGESWDWVSRTSPSVDVDGRSLHEFLLWACREMGLELSYQGDAERVARYDAILKGTIDTAPPDALRLRLASAALAWRIDDGGVIHVSDRP